MTTPHLSQAAQLSIESPIAFKIIMMKYLKFSEKKKTRKNLKCGPSMPYPLISKAILGKKFSVVMGKRKNQMNEVYKTEKNTNFGKYIFIFAYFYFI